MKIQLREMRKKAGISVTELSRESGVSRMTIYKIERGDKQARTTRTLQKLADALRVPVTDLFEI